jgi:hypothetical protein
MLSLHLLQNCLVYLAAIAHESGTKKPSDAEIYDACAQLRRLLQERPTTPMFAAMWAEEIGRVGQTAAIRIQGVARHRRVHRSSAVACLWTQRRAFRQFAARHCRNRVARAR